MQTRTPVPKYLLASGESMEGAASYILRTRNPFILGKLKFDGDGAKRIDVEFWPSSAQLECSNLKLLKIADKMLRIHLSNEEMGNLESWSFSFAKTYPRHLKLYGSDLDADWTGILCTREPAAFFHKQADGTLYPTALSAPVEPRVLAARLEQAWEFDKNFTLEAACDAHTQGLSLDEVLSTRKYRKGRETPPTAKWCNP